MTGQCGGAGDVPPQMCAEQPRLVQDIVRGCKVGGEGGAECGDAV